MNSKKSLKKSLRKSLKKSLRKSLKKSLRKSKSHSHTKLGGYGHQNNRRAQQAPLQVRRNVVIPPLVLPDNMPPRNELPLPHVNPNMNNHQFDNQLERAVRQMNNNRRNNNM